jgi:thiamine monophosphate kinase
MARQDASKKFDASQLALHGGDDYELLFTVAKKNVAKTFGPVALTQIGEITAQKNVVLADQRGLSHIIKNKSWDSFR